MQSGNRSVAAKDVTMRAERSSVPIWLSRCLSRVATLTSQVRREGQLRRASAELAALDDRALRDIGIMRHEIDHFVRGRRRRPGDF